MRKTQILLLSLLSMLLIVSSCKKDDPINETDVLIKYVEANIPVKTLQSYIDADGVEDLILTQAAYIIDIRSAA